MSRTALPKTDAVSVLLILLFKVLAILILCCIALRVYVTIKYGNVPPQNCPVWAEWLLQ